MFASYNANKSLVRGISFALFKTREILLAIKNCLPSYVHVEKKYYWNNILLSVVLFIQKIFITSVSDGQSMKFIIAVSFL